MEEHRKDGMLVEVYKKYVRIYPDKDNDPYANFYLWRNPGNCKLFTLDNVKGIMGRCGEKAVKALKYGLTFVSHYDDVFFINVTSKRYVEQFEEYFEMLYCTKIPLGYGGGYHYHCLFASHKMRDKYMKRIKKEGIEMLKPEPKEESKEDYLCMKI